ncbi:hypothetical protein ABPG74_018492 [Tetrahymena malaccensis]
MDLDFDDDGIETQSLEDEQTYSLRNLHQKQNEEEEKVYNDSSAENSNISYQYANEALNNKIIDQIKQHYNQNEKVILQNQHTDEKKHELFEQLIHQIQYLSRLMTSINQIFEQKKQEIQDIIQQHQKFQINFDHFVRLYNENQTLASGVYTLQQIIDEQSKILQKLQYQNIIFQSNNQCGNQNIEESQINHCYYDNLRNSKLGNTWEPLQYSYGELSKQQKQNYEDINYFNIFQQPCNNNSIQIKLYQYQNFEQQKNIYFQNTKEYALLDDTKSCFDSQLSSNQEQKQNLNNYQIYIKQNIQILNNGPQQVESTSSSSIKSQLSQLEQINSQQNSKDLKQFSSNQTDFDQFQYQISLIYKQDTLLYLLPLTIHDFFTNQKIQINDKKQIQNLLMQKNITHIGFVCNDGDSFYRMFITLYLKLKISQMQNDRNKLSNLFGLLNNVKIQLPTNFSDYFTTQNGDQIVKYASKTLSQYFSKIQNSLNPLQRFIKELNTKIFDFSLQLLARSLLFEVYQHQPKSFQQIQDENILKEELLNLNAQAGSEFLFVLVQQFLNCQLYLLNSRKKQWSQIECPFASLNQKFEPFFISESEQMTEIFIWYNYGHFHYFLTKEQMNRIQQNLSSLQNCEPLMD